MLRQSGLSPENYNVIWSPLLVADVISNWYLFESTNENHSLEVTFQCHK